MPLPVDLNIPLSPSEKEEETLNLPDLNEVFNMQNIEESCTLFPFDLNRVACSEEQSCTDFTDGLHEGGVDEGARDWPVDECATATRDGSETEMDIDDENVAVVVASERDIIPEFVTSCCKKWTKQWETKGLMQAMDGVIFSCDGLFSSSTFMDGLFSSSAKVLNLSPSSEFGIISGKSSAVSFNLLNSSQSSESGATSMGQR